MNTRPHPSSSAPSRRIIWSSLLGVFAISLGCTKAGLNSNRLEAPDPTIISIVPNYGPPEGGTQIQVIGTHFTPRSVITIDGQDCLGVTFISKTEIRCTTPAHVLGAVDVIVIRPAGTGRGTASSVLKTVTVASGFTYTGPLSNTPIYSVTSGGTFSSNGGITRRSSIAVIGGSVGQTGGGIRKVSGLMGVLSGR